MPPVSITRKKTSRPMVKDKGQGVDPHIYDLLIYDQWVKKIYIIFNKRCFIGQKLKIKTQL